MEFTPDDTKKIVKIQSHVRGHKTRKQVEFKKTFGSIFIHLFNYQQSFFLMKKVWNS